MKKIVLIILNGLGEGKKNFTNPFHLAKKDFFNFIREHFPFYLLQASGISVGLPWNEPGNTQISHLSIGIGKVYYQYYPRITLAIKNGSFFENEVLKNILEHSKKYNSRVHLVGLLTNAIIHSSFDHLIALLEFFKNNNFKNVFLHLFLDGIDSKPQSGLEILSILENKLNELKIGEIATLCGRSYGMDMSKNWLIKTAIAFNLITQGAGRFVENYKEYIKNIYEKNPNFVDKDLEPLVIKKDGIVKDNDVIFFFNFREDGMEQLARAFLEPNFDKFKRPTKNNLMIASMTKYLKDVDYPVAFPPEKITTSLTKILAENNLKQIKIVEQSKSLNLTYYFNGLVKEKYPGEFWKIVPDFEGDLNENPLGQSDLITDLVIESIREGVYDFIVALYSAPDRIGHTGNLNLGIKVIEGLDSLLKNIYEFIKTRRDFSLIIMGDHGNLETQINLLTGEPYTQHTNNPVPCYIIDNDFYFENKTQMIINNEKKIRGTLIDIPATILNLMGINIPKEFEGKNLLAKL